MTKPIGVTIHHEDGSTLKVPVSDLAAAFAALETAYRGTGGGGGKYTYLNEDACPVHGPWKAIPAGVSKNTGRSYDAFWTCDTAQGEDRCTNKPSRDWIETHPAARGDASQATFEPTTATAQDTGEYDDLPF